MLFTSNSRRRYISHIYNYNHISLTLACQADDEMEEPYLKGFEWDPEESWTRLKVHTQKEGLPAAKKGKKKGGDE